MNRHACRKLSAGLNLVVFLLALAVTARAEGDIAFLTTQTSFTAGDAFSWMEVGRDWNRTLPGAFLPPENYAVPNVNQTITVETFRTTGMTPQLRMHFTITDITTSRPVGTPGGTQLQVGDRLIIQLDPNYSGHSGAAGANQLEIGNDHRFELVFNNDLNDGEMPNTPLDITNTVYKTPVSIPMLPNRWGSPGPLPAGVLVAVTLTGVGYDVQITIPFSLLGLTSASTGPVGISYAVLNDIANAHQTPMQPPGVMTNELTGSPFPSSMGLSYITDPGVPQNSLTTEDLSSGPWIDPSQWATGYFSVTSTGAGNDVNFSHMPQSYLSEDIRLGICGTSDFNTSFPGGGVADWNTNQVTLPGWYQYFPTAPCSMRVWVRVRRTAPGASAIKKRFAIFWGRPNIGGSQEWFKVVLSPPVTVTAAVETFNFLWTRVPPVAFTDHPCLRVYALPETLNGMSGATAINETFINNIDTDAKLSMMEGAYGVTSSPPSQRYAQMNFKALRTGSCPAANGCPLAALPGSVDGDSPMRIIKAGFRPEADGDPASAQQASDETSRRNFRVFVEGYGIEATPDPKRNYAYIYSLGGVGTLAPLSALDSQQGLTFVIEVSNPRFIHRDLTKNPPVDTLSPTRDVFVRVIFDLPPNTPTPDYTVTPVRTRLGPGETTKVTVTIRRPKGLTPDTPPSGFKRWGFSLHGGASFPHGDLSNVHGPGPNVGVDLEYRFNQRFSLEAIYTYNRFRGDTLTSPLFGSFQVDDLNLHVFSLNGKVYGNTSPVRPFFNFGGGAYTFTPGTTVRGGINVGGGLQFDVTPTFAIDTMYNFHNVFSSGSNLNYSTAQGGVRWRF